MNATRHDAQALLDRLGPVAGKLGQLIDGATSPGPCSGASGLEVIALYLAELELPRCALPGTPDLPGVEQMRAGLAHMRAMQTSLESELKSAALLYERRRLGCRAMRCQLLALRAHALSHLLAAIASEHQRLSDPRIPEGQRQPWRHALPMLLQCYTKLHGGVMRAHLRQRILFATSLLRSERDAGSSLLTRMRLARQRKAMLDPWRQRSQALAAESRTSRNLNRTLTNLDDVVIGLVEHTLDLAVQAARRASVLT
ncbi:hypothetical protein AB2N08_02165 [Massilia aurea]|uniref:hypothetical protein n=1 Tax=Massilia aurea TaxID=373040 RepID=UPI0034628990